MPLKTTQDFQQLRDTKLAALNAALTACVAEKPPKGTGVGARALQSTNLGDIKNPAALKYLLNDYKKSHSLSPSLLALENELRAYSLPKNTTSYTELNTWCQEHRNTLLEYATADYCLTHHTQQPRSNPALGTEDLAQLDVITGHLLREKTNPFLQNLARTKSQELADDIRKRVETLTTLIESQRISADAKLKKEYEEQSVMLGAEIRALIASINRPMWQKIYHKIPATCLPKFLPKEAQELLKAADHFFLKGPSTYTVSSDTLTYKEFTKSGDLASTPLLDKEGHPISPKEMAALFNEYIALRQSQGADPVNGNDMLNTLVFSIHSTVLKNVCGKKRYQFSSPDEFARARQYAQDNIEKHRKENKEALEKEPSCSVRPVQ